MKLDLRIATIFSGFLARYGMGIKSTSMVYETKKVGVRTKTTVAILYMRDIVDPKIVQDIKGCF